MHKKQNISHPFYILFVDYAQIVTTQHPQGMSSYLTVVRQQV